MAKAFRAYRIDAFLPFLVGSSLCRLAKYVQIFVGRSEKSRHKIEL